MQKTLNRDEKLEQIVRLREYQKNNTSHVNTLAGIASPNMTYTDTEMPAGERTGYRGRLYGKLRLALSLLLFCILCLYHFTLGSEKDTLVKNLQDAVRADYSVKVIDFVKDITYTLDYEKTGIN